MKVKNKTIAINTIMLYIRMLFVMAINLYTSRVILHMLGVTDYGIYNVVGGVVTFFAFFQGPLTDATRRFLTFSIGTGNYVELKKVFSCSLFIHIIICALILIVSETVGVWLLYNKMVIPADRMLAAFWTLQGAIAVVILLMISTPYNADIIANEKMNAFAYISILEVSAKLGVLYLLSYFSVDRLILYSGLLILVQILVCVSYMFYCFKNFSESRTFATYDKSIFKVLSSFIGWTMTGGISSVCFNQGVNILLNIFFNPVVNAARGITMQVQSGVFQFCNNFQVAVSPQLTKTYAQKDFNRMHSLLVASSKFSFYLVLMISMPLFWRTSDILHLWLGIVPDYTEVFVRIALFVGLINSLANPLIISNHATGELKKFQIIVESIQVAILPISYVVLRFFDGNPESVFYIQAVATLIAQYARMEIVLPKIGMAPILYSKKVIVPSLLVLGSSLCLDYLFFDVLFSQAGPKLLISCIVCVLISIFCSFIFGCSKVEKQLLKGVVLHKLGK